MDKSPNLTPDGVLLKQRFSLLIDKCGGVKNAELMTRVGQRVLYEYANPDRSDLFPPVDIVADLEKPTGAHFVTEAMCFLAGGYFVKPTREEKIRTAFGAVMPAVGQDIGQLIKDAYAATDGKFTSEQIDKLRGDIERAMSDLALARGVLEGAAR
ncbi:MAG TPA: phage regulatory CII family protein [Terriglobales bacterium]|nr:phage regulatory CII family protein [Terriglobales bacterium]